MCNELYSTPNSLSMDSGGYLTAESIERLLSVVGAGGLILILLGIYLSFLNFFFIVRTLLALGCHVAQVNVHAEDDLKKIKLPKE